MVKGIFTKSEIKRWLIADDNKKFKEAKKKELARRKYMSTLHGQELLDFLNKDK
jgi:hypothetical protein